MTNFDFLKNDKEFSSFADVAINAEKILHIDPCASALNCRRALELAVKWMYSVDRDLKAPYQDTLAVLTSTKESATPPRTETEISRSKRSSSVSRTFFGLWILWRIATPMTMRSRALTPSCSTSPPRKLSRMLPIRQSGIIP